MGIKHVGKEQTFLCFAWRREESNVLCFEGSSTSTTTSDRFMPFHLQHGVHVAGEKFKHGMAGKREHEGGRLLRWRVWRSGRLGTLGERGCRTCRGKKRKGEWSSASAWFARIDFRNQIDTAIFKREDQLGIQTHQTSFTFILRGNGIGPFPRLRRSAPSFRGPEQLGVEHGHV